MNNNERYKFYDDNLIKKGKRVDWQRSIGKTFKVIYEWKEYELVVVSYCKKTKYVTVSLDGEVRPPIFSSNLKRCAIGKIVKKITNEFKINIGDVINDNNRNIKIIDRFYIDETRGVSKVKAKRYKYVCNNCGYTGKIDESSILRGTGCSCCIKSPKKAVLGINTIWDTDRWMLDVGVSEEDAKKYTKCSSKSIIVQCPDCGTTKSTKIQYIYSYKFLPCICRDGWSKPEKYMYKLLQQLNVDFQKNYSPEYLVRVEGEKKSRKYSDFFIPSKNIVIETDGGIGHKGGKVHGKSKFTLDYYVEVDKWKDNEHMKNSVHTIRVDCRVDDFDKIKDNILKSDISKMFNLDNVDWKECERFSVKNLVKDVCDYWNIKKDTEGVSCISKKFNLNRTTVIKYLKNGTRFGWCEYYPKQYKN